MTHKVCTGAASLRKVGEIVAGLNPKFAWRIEIARHQERRTLSQNKRYWAAVMELANETGYSKDEMHEALKRKFLPPVMVELGAEMIEVPASSAKLGRQVFSDYMERVIAFAATEFGIVA